MDGGSFLGDLGYATDHAETRWEERLGETLADDVRDGILDRIAIARLAAVGLTDAPIVLATCMRIGAVLVRHSYAGRERWAVSHEGRWIYLIVSGTAIVTVITRRPRLPAHVAAARRRPRHHARPHEDDA